MQANVVVRSFFYQNPPSRRCFNQPLSANSVPPVLKTIPSGSFLCIACVSWAIRSVALSFQRSTVGGLRSQLSGFRRFALRLGFATNGAREPGTNTGLAAASNGACSLPWFRAARTKDKHRVASRPQRCILLIASLLAISGCATAPRAYVEPPILDDIPLRPSANTRTKAVGV